MEADNISQIDEVVALSSIYGDDWKSEGSRNFSYNIGEAGRDVMLLFHLPENYPSESPPSFEMSAPALTKTQKNIIHEALNDVYLENLGGTVLFQWIEKVREILQSIPQERNPEDSVENVPIYPEIKTQLNLPACPDIIHGVTIEDRKSVFQGHVARIKTPYDVEVVLQNLKMERKIASATHNILAWKCGNQRDCDDDGEKAAGGRLAKLIDLLGVDNVVIVVSRWYGGIHLGGDRFRHITNAARQTIELARIIER